ncbi:hypothetical protein PS934_04063 [Pseudomonas fluorescens]|jgi:hypothetical protein|uniref:hypothetical protein n=1 Tax=Pseudomonas fluorescens TaxID=294 RepID=UPI001242F2E2|nr:hypothetical protein [Pseudomonas fluorescens]VVQ14203.1 hypothetical protein PS934_04063 [Pseudomonas fluorescens]
MTKKNGANAPRGSAWPEKPVELFYVTHPKAERVQLGPFLTLADAELGIVVMRSPGAVAISVLFAAAAHEVPND